MHQNFWVNKKGFTLIELIVVMTIMAVITVIAVVSFSAAGVKSRDGRRQSDLSKIQIALGLYYQVNGSYPTKANVLTALVPTYLQSWPTDPKGTSYATYDYENPTAYTYLLGARMEDTSLYSLGTYYPCGPAGPFQGIVGMTYFHFIAPVYALVPGGGALPTNVPPPPPPPPPAPGGCNYSVSNP